MTMTVSSDILDLFSTIPTHPSSYFFTFEGIEGSGKTTQMERLANFFTSKGYEVKQLREPGSTHFGERLREVILKQDSPLAPYAEAHLFASARSQLVEKVLIPFLAEEKKVVLCDRYIDSSLCYQGVARGLGIENVLKMHAHPPLCYFPHKTFYLKIATQTSWERQAKRNQEKDYFEREKIHFYEKLMQGHEELCQIFPARMVTVDAEKNIDEVYQQMEAFFKNQMGFE